MVLGAALQRGALPVSREALEEALRLNGTGVERNLAALAWGRAAVAAPEAVAAALAGEPDAPPALAPGLSERIAAAGIEGGELGRLVAVRVADLDGWGGRRAVGRYLEALARVRAAEAARLSGSTALSEAVARGLHKLIAYKDEYEVARLHLDGLGELPAGAKLEFHLHPPLLRALGMKRKLKLGGWFVPGFRALRRARSLRGTALDPFGYAAVRRVERALPGEYLELLDPALERLGPDTLALAIEIAELPELVRGYEEIKLAGVERFRRRGAELRGRLAEPRAEAVAA
ncbi:MAG: DUF6537 domain-containing protein [Solirubrobacterales bacterium]